MSVSVRIERIHRDKVPAGTKILTENEVFQHYVEITQKWKPGSDVWPFKYGWIGLGIASCGTNFFILSQYRRRLKLTSGIMAVMTFGCAVIPSLLSPFGHIWYVTKKVFVQDSCMPCLHAKSVGIQLLSALGYALTVNPLLCFLKAQQFATCRVPGISTAENRRQTWQLYKKFTKRASGSIYTYAVINSIVASAITAKEIQCFIALQEKIEKRNKEVAELKKKLPQ